MSFDVFEDYYEQVVVDQDAGVAGSIVWDYYEQNISLGVFRDYYEQNQTYLKSSKKA